MYDAITGVICTNIEHIWEKEWKTNVLEKAIVEKP